MKRYSYDRIVEGMMETPIGDYVRYEEAATLDRLLSRELEMNEELLKTGEALLSAAEQLKEQLDKMTAERNALQQGDEKS